MAWAIDVGYGEIELCVFLLVAWRSLCCHVHRYRRCPTASMPLSV